jgi:hypothetical protein
MKCTFHIPTAWLWILAFHPVLAVSTQAQSCGFSSGKSMHELQIAVHAPLDTLFFPKLLPAPAFAALHTGQKPLLPNGPFLPRWSADDLPFFCKIEHDWSKNRVRIPVKFRLGSVDYVDWLEGKSWDKLRY